MAYFNYKGAWVHCDGDPRDIQDIIHAAWQDLQNLKMRSGDLNTAEFTRPGMWTVRTSWGKEEIFITPVGGAPEEWITITETKYVSVETYYLAWDLMLGQDSPEKYTSGEYKILAKDVFLKHDAVFGTRGYVEGLQRFIPASTQDVTPSDDPVQVRHYEDLVHVYPHYLNHTTSAGGFEKLHEVFHHTWVYWYDNTWIGCVTDVPANPKVTSGIRREWWTSWIYDPAIGGTFPIPGQVFCEVNQNETAYLCPDYVVGGPCQCDTDPNHIDHFSPYGWDRTCHQYRDEIMIYEIGPPTGSLVGSWDETPLSFPLTEDKPYKGGTFPVYRVDPHYWGLIPDRYSFGAVKDINVYMLVYTRQTPPTFGRSYPDFPESILSYHVHMVADGNDYNYEYTSYDEWNLLPVDQAHRILECHIYDVPWGYCYLFTTFSRYFWTPETRQLQYNFVNYVASDGKFDHYQSRIYTEEDGLDWFGFRPITYEDQDGQSITQWQGGTFRLCKREDQIPFKTITRREKRR